MEWNRVLKPGGRVQLIVPDLQWAVEFWLSRIDNPDNTGWPLDVIFGNQTHEGQFHKTGFTPRILWQYFHLSGMWFIHHIGYWTPEEPEFDVVQRCINVEAEKWDPNKDYDKIAKERGLGYGISQGS